MISGKTVLLRCEDISQNAQFKRFLTYSIFVALFTIAIIGAFTVTEDSSVDATAEPDIIELIGSEDERNENTFYVSFGEEKADKYSVTIINDPRSDIAINGTSLTEPFTVDGRSSILATVTVDCDYRITSISINTKDIPLSDDEIESGTTLELSIEKDTIIEIGVEQCYVSMTINAASNIKVTGEEVRYNATIQATEVKPDSVDWGDHSIGETDMAYYIEAFVGIEEYSAFRGDLTISIYVGTEYDGTMTTVLHKSSVTGLVESYQAKVIDGYATVTVSDLSPFLISLPDVDDVSVYMFLFLIITGIIIIAICWKFKDDKRMYCFRCL